MENKRRDEAAEEFTKEFYGDRLTEKMATCISSSVPFQCYVAGFDAATESQAEREKVLVDALHVVNREIGSLRTSQFADQPLSVTDAMQVSYSAVNEALERWKQMREAP